jgi:hypothetical protein
MWSESCKLHWLCQGWCIKHGWVQYLYLVQTKICISFLYATQTFLSFTGPVHSICYIQATIKYWILTVRNAQLVSP